MLKSVMDADFRPYGRVLDVDTAEFLGMMAGRPVTKAGQVDYEPELATLQMLSLCNRLAEEIYGNLPVEFGHCSGWNDRLNALEFHRSSEVDIAATDLVLMLGKVQDIDEKNLSYDTSKVESFLVPRGTAVEIYATTLHYAPCSYEGQEFRMGVVLPKGTNLALGEPLKPPYLLQARNKWLLAHHESGLGEKICYGLKGKNLRVS